MQNIVLIQGPPRSGKDTIGRFIMTELMNNHNKPVRLMKFAAPVNAWMMSNFGVDCNDGHSKSTPCAALGGLTRRQVAIKYSEEFMKPTFGDDIFGKFASNSIDNFDDNWHSFVFTDSGFKPEGEVIINEYGAKICTIIKVYREGKSFKDDSRSFWSSEGVREVAIYNKYQTESELRDYVRDCIVPPLVLPSWV
jgi:hypothetical protein